MTERRILSLACLLVVGAILSAPAPSSAAPPKKAKGSITKQAWYAQAAPCLTVIDCAPLPVVSPYPEDTLHVAVSAGQETARTYLALDFDLPRGGRLTGGTLTLPLDIDPAHGAAAPETAAMVACLTTHKFKDVRGSIEAPPGAKCDVRRSATYDAEDAIFQVDLERFVKTWSKKKAALVLMPSNLALAQTQTWHVVLPVPPKDDKKATGITARLSYSLRDDNPTEATDDKKLPSIEVETLSEPPSLDVGSPIGGGSGFPTLASESSTPTITAPTEVASSEPVSDVTAQAPTEGFAGEGFAYPLVWALPLGLFIGLGAVGRALTKDLYRRGV
jgi:hypothetical protein